MIPWLIAITVYIVGFLVTSRVAYRYDSEFKDDLFEAGMIGAFWPIFVPLFGLIAGLHWWVSHPSRAERRKQEEKKRLERYQEAVRELGLPGLSDLGISEKEPRRFPRYDD